MLNTELDQHYKDAAQISHANALRVIFNAGYYLGAGTTPTASIFDEPSVTKTSVELKSKVVAVKPTAR